MQNTNAPHGSMFANTRIIASPGARCYYMHEILHDWSDEPALQILKNLQPAMVPGYSKLLIHDHVLSDREPHPQQTGYDLMMMVMVAGKERNEVAWRKLLGDAGLRIVRIWPSQVGAQSVIEAEVA